MKTKALYPDDIEELIARLKDEFHDTGLMRTMWDRIRKHAAKIMDENENPKDDK